MTPSPMTLGNMRQQGVRSLSVACGALLLLVLTGCATQQQADTAAEAQQRAANDDAQCRSNGVLPGSQGYLECRMNLDNQHAAAVQPQNPFSGAHTYHH
ncbi:MAG: hypothetical protein WBX05_15465 [Pseudolabrys sp.]